MSKIGQQPITIPEKVSISLTDNLITVKGEKGELSQEIPSAISVKQEDSQLFVSRKNDTKRNKALHGLIRSLIANMVTGVSQGYQKTLELVGTGYRVSKQGEKLILTLGFSHPVEVEPVAGIDFEVQGNNVITISGTDKQKVGQVAAEIRALKKPEPYKGKGIRYQGETVRRKPGKAAKVGAAAAGE